MTTFNIFHTTRVRIGVRAAPHIWGAGEIRDAGERRLFGGLARSEPFVTPHVWGTGEMSTEISAPYLGHWGNKHWKSRRIYVALGHDELTKDCSLVIYHVRIWQLCMPSSDDTCVIWPLLPTHYGVNTGWHARDIHEWYSLVNILSICAWRNHCWRKRHNDSVSCPCDVTMTNYYTPFLATIMKSTVVCFHLVYIGWK